MIFNKGNLDSLKPRDSIYKVMADGNKNLGIRIYPSGTKVFIVRIRLNGKDKIKTIGNYPAISVAKAKKQAQPIIDQYKAGIDVKEAERIEKAKDRTLRECFNNYLPTVKPTTQKDVKRAMSDGLSAWLDNPIKDITEDKVLKKYDARVKGNEHTNPARNRARLEMAYLRSVWNTNKKELNLDISPTSILNDERKGWNKAGQKTRRLDHETASNFYTEIQKLSKRDKNFFLLIYFTGMRANEAKNLKWEYIDLNNKSLTIPDTKNGKPLEIPLTEQAIAVLNEVKNSGMFVFSQVNRQGEITAMTSYSKSVANLKKNSVLWSPHDSRRGFIVAGGVLGLNSYMVKQLVNHYDRNDVHANYQTYTIAELRPAAKKIADYLEGQLIENNNVIEFKQRA